MAYHRDCGSDGSIANTVFSWIGQILSLNGMLNLPNVYTLAMGTPDATASHSGDSEWIIVEIRYSNVYLHWYTSALVTSAHYGTPAEGTRRVTYQSGIEWADRDGGYPRVWVAANKHANYASRSWCNAGRGPFGLAHDNCDANSPDVARVEFLPGRNIGSVQVNFISHQSCVPSTQPAFFPGVECFWRPDGGSNVPTSFQGWLQYPYGEASTAYLVPLLTRFECWTTSNMYDGQCIDQGVVR